MENRLSTMTAKCDVCPGVRKKTFKDVIGTIGGIALKQTFCDITVPMFYSLAVAALLGFCGRSSEIPLKYLGVKGRGVCHQFLNGPANRQHDRCHSEGWGRQFESGQTCQSANNCSMEVKGVWVFIILFC